MFCANNALTATLMECSHGVDIDPLSSVNPLMMNESVAVGWPIFIAFATGRPICMQLAC